MTTDELHYKLYKQLESNPQQSQRQLAESLGISSEAGFDVIKATTNIGRIIAPITYNILLQLLSYHVALIKGSDFDQPRNLAKSVTVE